MEQRTPKKRQQAAPPLTTPPKVAANFKAKPAETLKEWYQKNKANLKSLTAIKNCFDKAELAALTPQQRHLSDQSWLMCVIDEKTQLVGLQCAACSKAGATSPWGSGEACQSNWRTWFLHRHHQAPSHKKAVLKLLEVDDHCLVAPPLEEFEAMLQGVADGVSQRKMRGNDSYSDKTALMIWSLAEAIQEDTRQRLRCSQVISLARDARQQRLLLRFASTDSKLDISSGFLGMTKHQGDKAGDLVQSTRLALRRVATENGKPPRWYGGPRPKLDTALLKHISDTVEIMTTDAASNELLAGDVSRGRRDLEVEIGGGSGTALFKNLKLVQRDHAHAFRRLLSRPYHADPELEAYLNNLVMKKASIVQRIFNSHLFQAWFAEETSKQEADSGLGPGIRSLRAAKHRFETFSTPTGRAMLWLPALMNTAQRIVTDRAGTDVSQQVGTWLRQLSTEEVLQVAMVADASDEGLMLIRAVDSDVVDWPSIASTVDNFVIRIKTLFGEDAGVMRSGYTAHVINLLKDGRLHVFCQGTTLQPPSDSVARRCLDRMKGWMRLALQVLRTEFPNYSIFQSFSIFDLADARPVRGQVLQLDRPAATSLKRLAKFFDVDEDGLRAQFLRARPFAAKMKSQNSCDNIEAWQKAAQHKLFQDASDLKEVLLRVLAWHGSTSGVEQTFSKACYNRIGSGQATEEMENRILSLVSVRSKKPAEKQKFCERAREIYARSAPGQTLQRPKLQKIIILSKLHVKFETLNILNPKS